MRRIFFTHLFFIFLSLTSWSQNGDFGSQGQNRPESTGPSLDSLVIAQEDTLSNDYYAYSLDNLSGRTIEVDSLLEGFEEYELTRINGSDYATIGNVGSSAFPIFWRPTYMDKFDVGFHQHDPYKMEEDEIRFYTLEKPISKVYFAQGASQSSFTAKAFLARDFANGVSVTLDFHRINSESIYRNQEVRHTYIHLGMIHDIDSSRWKYSINFLSNSNFEGFNAGVSDLTLFDSPGSSVRSTYPVKMSDGYTYGLQRNYNARLYYFLSEKSKSKQYLQVKLNHERGFSKLVNPTISAQDSTVFSEKYIPSILGMRMPIANNRSELRASYHLETNLVRSMHYFRYGLNQVSTDIDRRLISEVVGGTENSFLWRGLSVNLNGYFGTVYNNVLLDLHPYAGYNYKEKAEIKFGFRVHTQPTAYIINRVDVTFENIRDVDPSLTSSQELYGSVHIPVVGFTGKISSFVGQNVPVLDSTGLEFELRNINYVAIDIEEKLSYKWLHFNNRFVTQLRTSSVYNMPSFYTSHELYLDGKLFGSLNFQAGVNLDYIPSYSLPSYSPLYSRFYGRNIEATRDYYRIDPYITFRVQGFKFFAKYENINDLWQDGVLFQVEDHPQFDGRFRFGVGWQLRN